MNLFGTSNFIRIYDNALTKKECDILISLFEKSRLIEGVVYKNAGEPPQIDSSFKKCMQLPAPRFSTGSAMDNIIKLVLEKYVIEYRNSFEAFRHLWDWEVDDIYSFQKYETEDDGFKKWHTEHGPNVDTSKRILAWMFYLNNAKSGTDFMHYPSIRAKMGRLVIWPSGWEYVHRGAPNKGLKYIITGWCSYKNSI